MPTPRGGINDPDDPGRGNNPNNSGGQAGSTYRYTSPNAGRSSPGWFASDSQYGEGTSRDDFFEWYDRMMTTPGFAALAKKGGSQAVRHYWLGELTDADPNDLDNTARLKGWLGADTPGGGPSGGGRGGSGSGGATKEQIYSQASASIKNIASTLGVKIDEGGVAALAKVVVDSNWSDDMLLDYLVPAANGNTGTVSASRDEIKANAAKQLLTVSDATADEWAKKIASGEMNIDGVNSLLQAQAAMTYGWAADRVNQGLNVRDMLLPTRDLLAGELEMPPESIDLMDPKWLGMVQTADDKTGATRAATASEVTMRARQQPEWSNTRAAAATAATVAQSISRMFGGGG